MRRIAVAVGVMLMVPSLAPGQAFNIDFAGSLTGPPQSDYGAAAGQVGVWNDGLSGALRDLAGTLTPVTIGGATGGDHNDIPGATGGDEVLMETVAIMPKSGNFVAVRNLEPGFYDLYLYMWGGHFQGEDRNSFRVSNGVNEQTGNVVFDGVWPGGHVDGVTYRSVRIEVLPQFRGFNLTYGSRDSDAAYVNGLQLVPVPAPSALFVAPLSGLMACRRRHRSPMTRALACT